MKLSEIVQTADWKSEKRVPIIERPSRVTSCVSFGVTTSLNLNVEKNVEQKRERVCKIRVYVAFFGPQLRHLSQINLPAVVSLPAFVLGKILETSRIFLRFFLRARSGSNAANKTGLGKFICDRCLSAS